MPDLRSQSPSWQTITDTMVDYIDEMLLIGVYSVHTCDQIAFSFSVAPLRGFGDQCDVNDGSQSANAKDVKNLSVVIDSSHVNAIISLLRSRGTAYCRLNIALMNFLCMRGTDSCMTGMSNFNMESTSLKTVDEVFFKLTHKHFTRSDSVEALHALQISAIVEGDLLLIGLCQTGEVSSLQVLKQLVDIQKGKTTLPRGYSYLTQRSVSSKDSELQCFSFDDLVNVSSICDDEQTPRSSEVQLRPRGSEVRREEARRATSFCEDWRTETLKSIRALTLASQLKADDDQRPLFADDVFMSLDIPDDVNDVPDTSVPVAPRRNRKMSKTTQV